MRHSFFRCTAIFILILSLGVGTAWANTTRHPVYCAIRPASLGETGELYLNVNKGKSFDGGVWYLVKMDKIATTIHKAETHETKDLYVAYIEYVEVGLQQMEFQIYDAAPPVSPRETHMAFDKWTTNSDTWTKQVFDYENKNFTTYPASLTQKKSYVYFDAADWNDNVKQLVISHGTYRGFNDLNHLSNTTLYYANPELNWPDAVCISFIGNSTSWSETGKWLNDIPIHSTHYTGYLHYSLQENSFNYFARRSGDKNGAVLSYNYWGTESTAYQNLNKTQTVQARVKATGSSYSDASFASWPGSVSAERTYMSSATATTSPSAANMTSATTDAVLTSSITLTASANSGYYFEGWGDASDSNPTDGTTAKTYSVTDTKTSYAFFSQTYTLTYDRKGNYTSILSVYSVDNFSGSTSSGSSIPTGHLITLVATPATGYEVEGWYSDAACTSPYTNGSGGVTIEGNTFKLASLNANTEVYCKFRPITYTVTLEGMEADGGDVPIDVEVRYDAVLWPLENKHTKAHYDLLGYWAASDDHGMNKTKRLIDENGNWIPDVEDYTGKDGEGRPTWRYADRNISLFADWKEKKYTVDVAVSPAGMGSVTLNGSPISKVENIGYVTHSAEMTAVPANAAWVFKEWQVTSEAHLDDVHYSKFKPTMKITATGNGQTLTAVFEKRYNLVGSKYDEEYTKGHMPEGGMPGFAFGSGAEFDIHSYTADGDNAIVNMSYTCKLEAGDYIFEIHDREKGVSLGRKNGDNIYVLNDGGSVELQGGEHQDQSIFFYPKHEGQYTFRITHMRKDGDFYYPTVTVERPHQLHMGHVHAEIDNTSATNSGDTGGTLSATIGGSPIYNDGLYNYGADIAYEASPATGYTAKWYTDNTYSSEFSEQPANSWTHSNVTDDENVYVRFTEIPTTVTLSNDENGKIQIGGVDKTETTVGVTTTRELTAVPNDGYKLLSWTLVSGDDIKLSSLSTNPTTLSGRGAGVSSGQEVRANFTYRYSIKGTMNGENWETDHFVANIKTTGRKDIGYVDIDLPANTSYQFAIYDLGIKNWYRNGSNQVDYMTNGNSYNWSFATEKAHNCGITTAGAGTYRFMWNITDKTMSVIYPNFVIYRTGDQGEDSESATHTTTSPVESYEEGGTIEQAIEFRMKVRELDKWYTLCLPFKVNKVCVWDAKDGAYYDIVPYYRPTLGGTFYTGHYIIRKPVTRTIDIEGFEGRDRWIDPESPIDYLPSANTPYIIQWHDSYFLNKYISFFGDTNQDIPSEFNAGERPSADDVVNIFGNNTMHSGTVRDAYLLDKDYGPSGAWLREAIGTDRKILPFECFIRANDATTTQYRILRRGMEETDTPTALEQISNHQSPMTIRVYTITGVLIGEYNDCSFQDAAHRIATDHNEGIYILRSENESMKLLLGGK